jgi:photosystem II stability/assembly factor-like uncharacterized protein
MIGALMISTRRIVRGVTYGAAVSIALASFTSAAPAFAAGVPGGFSAQSITWISPSHGWVLGAKACGKTSNCATSEVIDTSNSGKTWRLDGTIAASIPKAGNGSKGITEIRFASAKVGWAFGPSLYGTVNGGKTWKAAAIPGHGKQVLDLAVAATGTYMIVSPCTYGTGLCTKKPLTTWRRSLSATSWTKMPVNLRLNTSANVAALGQTVYLVNPPVELPHVSQFYVSTDGGAHFTARHVPCTADEENTLIQAVPYSATKVGLLCDGNPGFGKAVKAVYLSSNNGKTDTYTGTLGLFGIQAQLAISPAGDLAVASYSIGTFLYINDNHHAKWYMVIGSGDGGVGWNDITYVSAKVAYIVYSPASLFPGLGLIYATHDAGRHWKQVKL